jgi:hypothetical protein
VTVYPIPIKGCRKVSLQSTVYMHVDVAVKFLQLTCLENSLGAEEGFDVVKILFKLSSGLDLDVPLIKNSCTEKYTKERKKTMHAFLTRPKLLSVDLQPSRF